MKAAANTNESALIARVLANETELFHELIRPYERLVYVTIFTILKNETEAEDGAQETMISAYRNLKSFRGEAKFSTWLVTIAMNEARKRLRKAKSVAEEPLNDPAEQGGGDFTPALLTDWREIPLEALERKELKEKLREAVARLPEKYREVFVLRDVDRGRFGNQCDAGEGETAPGTHDAAEIPGTLPQEPGAAAGRILAEVVPMKLECKHVWEHISGYLDKQLDPEVLAAVERHLESCEICSAIVDSTRNILVLTADDRTYELPLGYSERLHARLEAALREGSG